MSEYRLSLQRKLILSLSRKLNLEDASQATQEQIDEYNRKDFASPARFATYKFLYRRRYYRIKQKTFVIPTQNGAVTGYLFKRNGSTATSLIVYFHDGGWTLGNMNKCKAVCSNICKKTGSAVLAVDYSLAPRSKFPIPVEDGYSALVWASEGMDYWCFDESKLFVMGNCAGGNIAAAVCRLARDRKGPQIAGQILIDPITDCRMRTPSYELYRETPFITLKQISFFIDNYRKDQKDILDPLFSPLLAQDNSRLPDALVISAETDPLHDDGMLYAQALEASGSSSRFFTALGQFHGFLAFSRGKAWQQTMKVIRDFASGVSIDDLKADPDHLKPVQD